jgi:hypothetical protein
MGLSQQIGSSSQIKPGVCTSITRPASPYEGQVVYETDTDKVLVWNGAAWYPNWNLPWGMQTYTTATTNDLTITTEELQITGSSFTAVTGRLYRITYYEPELYGSTSYMQVNIRNTNISGAIRQLHYVQLNGNNNVPSHLIWIGTLTAGATNFVATLSSYSGTGAAYRAANQVAYLAVEDVGPA